VIIQSCIGGPTVEERACVSGTNGCNVSSELDRVPYCTQSNGSHSWMCVCVCVLLFTQGKFLCAVDTINPYVI